MLKNYIACALIWLTYTHNGEPHYFHYHNESGNIGELITLKRDGTGFFINWSNYKGWWLDCQEFCYREYDGYFVFDYNEDQLKSDTLKFSNSRKKLKLDGTSQRLTQKSFNGNSRNALKRKMPSYFWKLVFEEFLEGGRGC